MVGFKDNIQGVCLAYVSLGFIIPTTNFYAPDWLLYFQEMWTEAGRFYKFHKPTSVRIFTTYSNLAKSSRCVVFTRKSPEFHVPSLRCTSLSYFILVLFCYTFPGSVVYGVSVSCIVLAHKL